jgi:mannosyltransferase
MNTADSPPSVRGPAETRWRVALLSLAVVGCVLRFAAIDAHSFWYDEAVTASVVTAPYGELFSGTTGDNGNPPLYYIVARAWVSAFGRSEVGLRSLSAVVGILAVPLLASLGRRLLGARVGLAAGALLAISPMALELSNEARTYSLLLFLAIANTSLFVAWCESRRRATLVLYALSMALCLYCHYYAMTLPLAHGAALVASGDRRRLARPWLLAMACAALMFVPWGPAFVRQLGTPGNLSRSGDGWRQQFLATPLVFGLGRTFAWRDSGTPALVFGSLAVVLCLGYPALRAAIGLRSRPFVLALLSSWLLVPTLGPFLVALCGKPLYMTRYAIVGLPAFLILAATGLTGLRIAPRVACVATLLILSAVSIARYAALPLKDDWRSATRTILARATPAEPLLFDGDIEIVPFRYYVDRSGQAMPAELIGVREGGIARRGAMFGVGYSGGRRIDKVPQDLSDRLAGTPGLWLALCVPAESPEQYRGFLEGMGYILEDQYQFSRIRLLHFSRRPSGPPVAATGSLRKGSLRDRRAPAP